MTGFISKVLQAPQRCVDKIGMYRVVSGSLGILFLYSLVTALLGWLPYTAGEQLLALAPALVIGLLLNTALGRLVRVHTHNESAVITVLILFFLFIPGQTWAENYGFWLAVVVAVVSKFILVYRKQHIFNAAALGAVVVSFTPFFPATWWVANPILLAPLLILGTAVVLKVRKWTPVLWFIGTSLAVYLFVAWRYGDDLLSATVTFFTSWPTLFLAFFMLTEPVTLPATKRMQGLYGAVVGALSNSTFVPLMTPEIALVVGNIVAYPFRLRQKLFLELIERREIATDIHELVFKKPTGFSFEAGQYLEWMLPHDKPDNRGKRRYFTIASAPTEAVVRLAVKTVEKGSSYKKRLLSLDVGEQLIASQLAGDFTLPKRSTEKLGFIAGGIGVTPFRSHVQHMVDSDMKHDTKLFYCCRKLSELAFVPEFTAAAAKMDLELIPVISDDTSEHPHETGWITEAVLQRRSPDFKERTWYLSGPPVMVDAYAKLLSDMGVSSKRIKKDFFPGLS